MKTAIDSAGRVVIPKAIREAAGLTPGSPLRIELHAGTVVIERKAPKVKLIRKGPVLVASVPGAKRVSAEQVNEWIGKSRDREL